MAQAGTAGRSRGRAGPRRHAPAAAVYLAVLLAGAVLILPSALRPPPDPATQSAELSPDAPPDEQQDALVASLNRGTSSTPGQLGDAVGDVPVPPAPSRSCPSGRGDPPRQVESPYAAPCAPSFVGDNGGATYQGVTADEIRININGANIGGSDPCADGKLPSDPPPGECESDRTFRVYMQYFNENFQLYGRRIQFYVSQADTVDEPTIRAAAVKADEEYQVFGSGFLYAPGCQELAERHIINFCSQLPKSAYAKYAPYIWGWDMDGTSLIEVSAEHICKQLVGKPAEHAGDPVLQTTKRKFGLVYFASRGYAENGPHMAKLLRDCGAEVVEISATLDTEEGTAGVGTAIARFASERVTTVLPYMDGTTQIALTNQAEANGYFPEWHVNGAGANTFNGIGQVMNQREWAHAFGLTPFESERPNDLHDCWRAYRSIDPANNPNYTVCKGLFFHLLQLVNGIQLAGPNLTPESFAAGLISQGVRIYDKPTWAVGGGFTGSDRTYIDNVALVWWDPTAQDPQYLNALGAYMYENNAERHLPGDIPTEHRAFNPENAVITPSDGAEYDGP